MSALTAATLVGVISIGNGIGRIFWAWISDVTSRRAAFMAMYLLQVALFLTYRHISSPAVLTIVTFII